MIWQEKSETEQILKLKVKGKQETEPVQRHLGPGYTEGVRVQEAKERQALSSNFEKHIQLDKKEDNVCSYWRHGDFQLNRATQSDFSKPKSHQCGGTIGKNCQQFNHHAGSDAGRSMTNCVPAGLNSQLQCYPCSSDKALTADHNTCEQELPRDNKAMLRPMAKWKVSMGDSQKMYCIKFTSADMQNWTGLGSTGYGFNHSKTLRKLEVMLA